MTSALLLAITLATTPPPPAVPPAATSVEAASSTEPRLSRPVRVALEGVAAGALSGLALYAIDRSTQPSGDKTFLSVTSLGLLAPLTVVGTGWLMDSDGEWWGAWLGLIPGVLVGSGLALAGVSYQFSTSHGWAPPLYVAALMSPGLFSALGYELAGLRRSRSAHVPPPAPGTSQLRLAPSIGWAPVSKQRLAPVYGLAGSF